MALLNSQSLGRTPRNDTEAERTPPMPNETKPEGTAADAVPGLSAQDAPKAPKAPAAADTGAKLPDNAATPAGPAKGTAADALPSEGQADRAVERAADRADGGS